MLFPGHIRIIWVFGRKKSVIVEYKVISGGFMEAIHA